MIGRRTVLAGLPAAGAALSLPTITGPTLAAQPGPVDRIIAELVEAIVSETTTRL